VLYGDFGTVLDLFVCQAHKKRCGRGSHCARGSTFRLAAAFRAAECRVLLDEIAINARNGKGIL
jgi:hypothetical protein